MRNPRYWMLVGLMAGASATLAAAEPSHPCARVADPAQRLACYDKAYPLAPGVLEQARQLARAAFGLERGKDVPRNPGQSQEEADPDRVQGKVARVSHGNAGQRVITLDGGQTWITTEATTGAQMRPGDTVTLRKGLMGNYLLTTQGGGVVRVKRVR
jgi:hypothetical protein